MRKINVKTSIIGLQISGCAGSVRNGNVRTRNVGGCGWVISRRQIERKKRPIPILGMLRDIHLCPIIIKYHTASFARRRQRGYQIKLASECPSRYIPWLVEIIGDHPSIYVSLHITVGKHEQSVSIRAENEVQRRNGFIANLVAPIAIILRVVNIICRPYQIGS